MKLATACYGFREWSITNYLFAAAGLGVKHVEIGYTKYGTLQELYHISDANRALASTQLLGQLEKSDSQGIARVKALADEASVKLASSVVNYRLWGVSKTQLDWAIANIRLDIEIGAALGLDVMRVCEIGYPAGLREEQVFDDVVKMGPILNQLAKFAEEHGVIIMAENFRASSDLILAVASHFTSPNVGIHFDPHNYCRVGEDPTEALRRVKEFVRYCHLKDYRREDGQVLPTDQWWPSWAVGQGEIDWRSLFEELATFYDGVVAIEYEKHLHDVLRGFRTSIDYVRSLMGELNIEIE